MKIRTTNKRMLTLYSALALAAIPLTAQEAPKPQAKLAEEEVVIMDPFTVTADPEGYQATDTLGGARVRSRLVDTASATSVVTPKLMQDLGITNAQDLLVYTTNTEVAGLNGNYSGVTQRGFGAVGAAEGSRLVNPSGVNRARGLTAMDSTRNYFLSEIPWDGFNISRVDISRGPNSFLFGVGSPSGISNVTTNEAVFKNKGAVEAHVGSFGTTRESLDYNHVLLPSQLAFRLDLVNDDTQFQQKPAYNHSKRAYGTVRFEPKFLHTDSSHTKLQVNYEAGQVDANNPREMAPLDFISGYFNSGTKKTGYDPFRYVPNNNSNDPSTSPWVSNSDIHYAWGNAATYWYDAASGNLQRTAQAGVGGTGAPGGLNGVSNVYNIYTTGFSQYAINSNFANAALFPGANARTVNYLDKSLTDPSIFDFYNKLIDGPNKHEWQRWNAFNVNLVQSLFNNRLVFQAVADHESYRRGQEGALTGYLAPYISVDLNTTLLTYPSWLTSLATPNPNLGRPFIAGDFGGGDNASFFTHNNYQLTTAATLEFQDFMGKTTLAKNLGHHEFTVLAGRYNTKQEDRSWNMYSTDENYAVAANLGAKTLSVRNINWVEYLGSSLSSASSAKGANLSNMARPLVPTTGPVSNWSNTWTAGSSVDPTAPWIYTGPSGSVTSTQANNPANYAGYKPLTATVLSSQANIDQLYTQGNKKEQMLTSRAFMYQGHFFDDLLIPQFGWRSDKVRQSGTQATINPVNGLASINYENNDPGVVLKTTSTSYGIAVHLPKNIKDRLPEGTDVTFYYFHGSNQTPKVRYGIDGSMLPNEQGKTDDYSVQIDALKGRATLRLTAFKTIDNNAQASYGQPLGAAGWLIDSLPSWTLTMAAAGIYASTATDTQMAAAGLSGGDWYWGWGRSNPALAASIATAIKKNFPTMFPQSYWDQYGLPVDMAAVAAGDWAHVVKNNSPYAWNINNSHLIHGATPIIDQNIVSKGYELEATVRPVKNWDLTFNASKVSAYQTALGASAANYLNGMANLWLNTDIGLTAEWGGGPIRNEFMSGIWAPYLTQVALTGTDQPELRKWNFKVITNYTFERGSLKGLNVGGAYRWAAKPILGYGIKSTTLFGNSAWIADVNQPLYGKIDSHFDLWIGYQRKLTDKIDWRIQLNVKNAFERARLTPISVEPDGSWAQQRIQMGQAFDLSCKFMF